MKRVLIALTLIMLLTLPGLTVYASERPDSGLAITVVVPNAGEQSAPIPAPAPNIPILYPVSVSENREHGRREIIRIYELADHENPDHIPREPFEREGFRFELADIVRSEMMSFDSRAHTETITVNTTTNDLETVIRLLSQTLEFQSDDGFIGVLTLDVSTIKIETAGTRTSTSTATRTREYPHLSNPDTALIPKSITDGGTTFNLSNVEWRAGNMGVINYEEIPQTYTAVATYSASISRTSVTGYNTTAEYTGVLSRMSQGRMRYTANFIGIPIVSPIITRPSETPDNTPEAVETDVPVISENIVMNDEPVETETEVTETFVGFDPETITDVETDETSENQDGEMENDKKPFGFHPVAVVLLLALVGAVAFAVGKYGKKALSKFKKPASMALIAAMMLNAPLTTYASGLNLPGYGFGGGNSANAVHFDTAVTNGNGTQPFIPGGVNVQHNHRDGDFIGRLTVAKTGRVINIYEGESMASMDKGGGRFSFSGFNNGNTAIIGHNRGQAGFFIFVKDLRENDILTLDMGGVIKTYAVTYMYTVSYSDFSPLLQYGDNRLTLVTCLEYQQNMRRIAVAKEI
jgi:LPXTG-site transpeptidase (sortase) family protein